MRSSYIALLNAFRMRRRVYPISVHSLALYFVLLEYANELRWPEWFCVHYGVLQGQARLSRAGFFRSRDELVKLGYIEYLEGDNRGDGRYRVIDIGVPSESQNEADVEAQTEIRYEMRTESQNEVSRESQNASQNGIQFETENGLPSKYKTKTKTKKKTKTEIKIETKTQTVGELIDAIPDDRVRSAARGFADMRLAIKKPLTPYGFTAMLRKLDALAESAADRAAILDQSVMHNWVGVFELKRPREKTGERGVRYGGQRSDWTDYRPGDLDAYGGCVL